MKRLSLALLFGELLLGGLAGLPAAQISTPQSRLVQEIDDSRLTTLKGNTYRLARPEFDQGEAPADLPMARMQLVLTRSAAQEAALQTLLAQQQDKSSPQYHQWLTPLQFGHQFGASSADIQKITGWLQSHGFQVNRVANGRNVIEFTGTAGQVQEAFHTAIHKYVVNGQQHWANSSDPRIPVALAPVVAGVATLHNFEKRPQLTKSNKQFSATLPASGVKPQFDVSDGTYALSPGDYAVIYNAAPLLSSGINGTGTTIAVVARTDILISDINSFRSTFGLPANPPNVIHNGTDPGDLGGDEEAEAVLDTSWAGAIATGATVDLVVSKSTNSSDGVDLSEEYIVDNALGDVMTESFGDCEADSYSAADATAISSLAEQAASEGITYTVAAGDSGATGCDDPSTTPSSGVVSVNILAATPYNIAVGGTMFNENGNYSTYWTPDSSSNTTALSYIPEDVWNESCDNITVTCTNGNTPGLWSGGGGKSVFFSKPSWQTGVYGIPNDGARDVPDVALTAAGHDAYLLCLDNSCTPNRRGRIYFQGYGGTSAATPSFAGIMALVVQKTGSKQGQAAGNLYQLAAQESLSQCNASNTSTLPASTCIFHDVTVGNNTTPGETGYGTTSGDYQATTGYDLASGLGSVNVTNLVDGWGGSVVSNQSQIRINVDQPGSFNSVIFGPDTPFAGWAITDSGSIASVAIAVDGVSYGHATYGLDRPDVCTAYPNRGGCPNVGWSLPFNSTLIADGSHDLEVTATASTGQKYTISVSFTVANWTTANPLHIDIDTPNSQTAALSGSVNFGGWAVDDLTSVSGLKISVDGVPFGSALYGGARPDVCAVYPDRAGCPNVGWNFTMNTLLVADGSHTLAVTATSAGGQSSTATAQFATENQSSSPLNVDIDVPQNQSIVSGTVDVGGWAIAGTGSISSVAVSMDGASLGNAVYGSSRPDVCAVYPGRSGCPNVGYNFLMDTTQFADGAHTVAVTAHSSAGQELTVSRSFSVSNNGATLPTKIYIDNPNAHSATLIGINTVSGWAINSSAAIATVSILVDGALKGNATYGSSRPDVCAAYPGEPGCPNVGWTFALDTTLLADGAHTLEVTATANVPSGSGTVAQTAASSTSINVANWTTSNPMLITIDRPNAQSGTFSGDVSFGGWAIDSLAAMGQVSIALDGVAFGNAVYGNARPDVCAVYPGTAGCPDVGWNFGFNTSALADGTHTLEVTGTTANGQSSTSSTTFNVANSSGNPVLVNIDSPALAVTASGTLTTGGWAIDTAGVGISSVEVFVDGQSYGLAPYGNARPDVCAVYPGSIGCPDVGWTFLLNTAALANGEHTFEARALAASGQLRTVSSTFAVFNFPYTN